MDSEGTIMKNIGVFGIILASVVFLIWGCIDRSNLNDRETNKIIIGTSADFAPYSFMKDGEIIGFDVDVVKEICKRMGFSAEIRNLPFKTLLTAIQLGEIQLIAAGLTENNERSKTMLFVKPELTSSPLVVISLTKNQKISSLDDLAGKEVVVNDGYTSDLYMSKIQGPILRRIKSPAEALIGVKSGRFYAFVTAKSVIETYLKIQTLDQFNTYIIPESNETSTIAISKMYADLLPKVQQAILSMWDDKTLDSLKLKWGLS
jgi:arginine/lysine/histidine transporter system substrate-binding protein